MPNKKGGKNALRNYNDHLAFQRDSGSLVNNQEALDSVMNSNATKYNGITDVDGYYETDLMKTGDYGVGTTQPGKPTEYTFTGEKTYNNNVGKSSINKARKVKKSSIAKNIAASYAKNLLTPAASFKHPDIMYASTADMTAQTTGGYGGTDIEGSWGGSLLQGAFDDNQRERISNTVSRACPNSRASG